MLPSMRGKISNKTRTPSQEGRLMTPWKSMSSRTSRSMDSVLSFLSFLFLWRAGSLPFVSEARLMLPLRMLRPEAEVCVTSRSEVSGLSARFPSSPTATPRSSRPNEAAHTTKTIASRPPSCPREWVPLVCAIYRAGNSTGSSTGPDKQPVRRACQAAQGNRVLRCIVNHFQNGDVKNSGASWGIMLGSRVSGREEDDEPSIPTTLP